MLTRAHDITVKSLKGSILSWEKATKRLISILGLKVQLAKDTVFLINTEIQPPLDNAKIRINGILSELTPEEHSSKLGNELKRAFSALVEIDLNLEEVRTIVSKIAQSEIVDD